MPASAHEKHLPDSQSRETLENSLAVLVVKLFAIIAKSDESITEGERTYVRNFFDKWYSRDISDYFFGLFEEFISRDIDRTEVTAEINARLPYQEKLFCLLKTYELATTEEVESKTISAAHRVAEDLDIYFPDVAFIEHSFGIGETTRATLAESSMMSLRVTGETDSADLFLPYPDLDVVIFKIHNMYCVTNKNDEYKISVGRYPLSVNASTRITHNTDLIINDYVIKYQDLKLYFDSKVYPQIQNLYISQKHDSFAVNYARTDDSQLHVRLERSLIKLTPIGERAEISVNRERVEGPAYVNINDVVALNQVCLNVKELASQVSARRSIRLAQHKRRYTLSNDPTADIYLPDEQTVWNSYIERKNGRFVIHTGDCPYRIYLNDKPVRKNKTLAADDRLYLNSNFLEFDSESNTVVRTAFNFKRLTAKKINYSFSDGTKGLDDISFSIDYGDLVCIMGPSGCGKSTLLNTISGLFAPQKGQILLDSQDVHKNRELIQDYMSYVPQDDLLIANLTVYENLFYNAQLRFPKKRKRDLDAKISLVLDDIGLSDKRDVRVGPAHAKTLSGGERKRLNIGLELLSNAEVLLLDEPTSGLSSKDSEKILDLLANISLRGKIVLTVIHQPSSKLYKTFNKVILLDKGGRLAYYGNTFSALRYFESYRHGSAFDEDLQVECPHCKAVRPEVLLDSMEESLRDIDGTILTARKYPPEHWKEQFEFEERTRLVCDLEFPSKEQMPPPQTVTFAERFKQFKTLFTRSFANKVRDRSNLIITFLEAPLLGAGVGFVLKYSPNPSMGYTFYGNNLLPTFLFVAAIVAIFLGMTNSVDEIITDIPLLQRERMLNVKNRAYFSSKLLVLIPFALLQNCLFLAAGFYLLELKELFWPHVLYLTLGSLAGISMGLFVSCIPKLSSRAAQNIVPLILVPQIILGGALIEFKDMNANFTVYEKSPIPEFCQFMPSRWVFEGSVILQRSYNSFDSSYKTMETELNNLKARKKDILAKEGEEAFTAEVDTLKATMDAFQEEMQFTFSNSEIYKAVEKAEHDYVKKAREATENGHLYKFMNEPYPMFLSRKVLPFLDVEVNTVVYNSFVLLFMSSAVCMLALFMLRFRNGLLHGMDRITKVISHLFGKRL